MAGSGAVEAGGVALGLKFGLFKALSGGAAIIGALLMAAIFEPKTKREMVLRAAVALGSSLLCTGWLMRWGANYCGIDIHSLDVYELMEYTLAVGGMVGALSWFALGAAGELLRRFQANPIQTIKDVRDALPPRSSADLDKYRDGPP